MWFASAKKKNNKKPPQIQFNCNQLSQKDFLGLVTWKLIERKFERCNLIYSVFFHHSSLVHSLVYRLFGQVILARSFCFLNHPHFFSSVFRFAVEYLVFQNKFIKLCFVGARYWSFMGVFFQIFPHNCQIKSILFHNFSWTFLNTVHHCNQTIFSPKSKRRRTPNRCTNEKGGKGLRHFSMKVCEKVQQKGVTTYNEVRLIKLLKLLEKVWMTFLYSLLFI